MHTVKEKKKKKKGDDFCGIRFLVAKQQKAMYSRYTVILTVPNRVFGWEIADPRLCVLRRCSCHDGLSISSPAVMSSILF